MSQKYVALFRFICNISNLYETLCVIYTQEIQADQTLPIDSR